MNIYFLLADAFQCANIWQDDSIDILNSTYEQMGGIISELANNSMSENFQLSETNGSLNNNASVCKKRKLNDTINKKLSFKPAISSSSLHSQNQPRINQLTGLVGNNQILNELTQTESYKNYESSQRSIYMDNILKALKTKSRKRKGSANPDLSKRNKINVEVEPSTSKVLNAENSSQEIVKRPLSKKKFSLKDEDLPDKLKFEDFKSHQLTLILVDCLNTLKDNHSFIQQVLNELRVYINSKSQDKGENVKIVRDMIKFGLESMNFYTKKHGHRIFNELRDEFIKSSVTPEGKLEITKLESDNNQYGSDAIDALKFIVEGDGCAGGESMCNIGASRFEYYCNSILASKSFDDTSNILLTEVLPSLFRLSEYFEENLRSNFENFITPPKYKITKNLLFNYLDPKNSNFACFLFDWLLFGSFFDKLVVVFKGKMCINKLYYDIQRSYATRITMIYFFSILDNSPKALNLLSNNSLFSQWNTRLSSRLKISSKSIKEVLTKIVNYTSIKQEEIDAGYKGASSMNNPFSEAVLELFYKFYSEAHNTLKEIRICSQ